MVLRHPGGPAPTFEAVVTAEILSAIRRWRKRWPLKVLILGTAAIGVAIFLALAALVNAVLLAEPFPGADHVARLVRAAPRGQPFTPDEILRAARETTLPIAAMGPPIVLGRSSDAPIAAWVSTNFFDVVGVSPLLGRTLAPSDDGLTDHAVISERLWRSRFGGDPNVVGHTVLVGDRRLMVLGVVGAGFSVPAGVSVWTPHPPQFAYDALVHLPSTMDINAVGARWPEWRAVSMREYLLPRGASYAWVLLASGGLLLAAAWAYFGLVQVSETSRRFDEIRVRLALGADFWKAIRPVAMDAFLDVVLCAVGGLLLTPVTLTWLATRLPPELVNGRTPTPDWRVALAVVLVLSTSMLLLTAGMLGLRARSSGAVVPGPARLARGGARSTRVMAAVQLSVVTPVLYVLGLSAESFHALATQDLGYRTENVLSAQVPLWSGAPTIAESTRYVSRLQPLLDRVAAIPDVREAAFSDDRLGFVPTADRIGVRLEGTSEREAVVAQRNTVSGAYFRLLGIRQVSGDIFGDGVRSGVNWKDIYGGVIVDTTLATALGHGADVVGRRVVVDFSPTTIMAVVAPIRSRHPDEAIEPRVYLRLSPNAPFATNLLVRFTGPAAPVAQALAAAVHEQMGTEAPADTVLLSDELRRLQRPYMGVYQLSLVMAWVASVLCLSGMLAVATYVLTRRRKEVAVRMAVGASRGNILRLCLLDIGWAMPVGMALGLSTGVTLSHEAGSRLFGVADADPRVLVGTLLIVAGVLLCAAVVPTRNALKTNLSDALRSD